MAKKSKTSSSDVNEIKDMVHQLGKDVQVIGKKVKGMYDDLDPESKKKVVTAITGLGALLVGSHAVKKVKKRSAKKKKK